jgi:hypothetical protein
MKEATREIWATRVEEWQKSGKTADEFAAAQPFSAGTLIWRASQLRRDGAASRRRRAAVQRGRPSKRVELAEVVRRPSSTTNGLTLEIAGARINVGASFDRELLREVLRALREEQA